MNYHIEGNELIIKKLFIEKRYNFRELTKLSLVNDLRVFQGNKCILTEKDIVKKWKHYMHFYHLAVKNDLMIEDQKWFDDEIFIEEIPSYCNKIQKMIKEAYYDYVKQELGSDYELEVSADISTYHAIIFVNILYNGEKVCAATDMEWYWNDGEVELPLLFIELVMPTYIDVKKQQFMITKAVDFDSEMEEVKNMIGKMKEDGCVKVNNVIEKERRKVNGFKDIFISVKKRKNK